MENTFVGRVSLPNQKGLLSFLGERVIGKELRPGRVQEVLDEWPIYAEARGIPHSEFGELSLLPDGRISCGESPGGPFIVAVPSQD